MGGDLSKKFFQPNIKKNHNGSEADVRFATIVVLYFHPAEFTPINFRSCPRLLLKSSSIPSP
jgi:alkyl hydroperoxide reductase subunit AhpC